MDEETFALQEEDLPQTGLGAFPTSRTTWRVPNTRSRPCRLSWPPKLPPLMAFLRTSRMFRSGRGSWRLPGSPGPSTLGGAGLGALAMRLWWRPCRSLGRDALGRARYEWTDGAGTVRRFVEVAVDWKDTEALLDALLERFLSTRREEFAAFCREHNLVADEGLYRLLGRRAVQRGEAPARPDRRYVRTLQARSVALAAGGVFADE